VRKYGNANHEKQIDPDGTTLVSKDPITEEMEKKASEAAKDGKKPSKDQEVVNINDRQRD